MSHPNNIGNGCSLEDCHTNLFALTDLAGIRWRKFKKNENVYIVEPLDDPVLQAFTRCIHADVLCVWQRAKRSGGDHSASGGDQLNNCNKELWLFWYGDEPSIVSTLHDKGLQEVDCGSWDAGLTYECRTLLFKALHNLIERCLLSRNFVRIGKWFVQPFDHLPRSTAYDKSTHLSIKFSFFLHGESTVCTSIDVRQHPPLWRLHPYHLNAAIQSSQQGLPVVLAPYGLAGTLTGHVYKESDSTTQTILEEWKQFFVVPDPETWECSAEMSTLPKVVEVVVAGVRMRYPASYILVHGDTEAEIIQQNGGVLPLTPPHIANASGVAANQQSNPLGAEAALKRAATGYADNDYDPVISSEGGSGVGARILHKMLQDDAMTSGVHHSSCQGNAGPHEGDSNTAVAGTWELGEPLQKNSCACHRCKGSKSRCGRASPSGHKHKGGDKASDKADKEGRRRYVPFHRRSTLNEAFVSREVDLMMMRLPPQTVGSKLPTPTTTNPPQPDPATTNSGSDGTKINQQAGFETTDSPHSAVPSPLVAHPIHSSDDQNPDVTMPTLSPQPVNVKVEKVDQSADSVAGDAAAVKVKKELIAKEGTLGDNRIKVEPGSNHMVESVKYRRESINTWLEAQRSREPGKLKRPCLAKQGYEAEDEEQLSVSALYDFDSLNQWLDYPLKRQKVADPDDICSQTHDGPLSAGFGLDSTASGANHDPYEFSDEASSGNVSYSGGANKRAFRGGGKDEQKPLQNGVALPDEEDISFKDEPSKQTSSGMGGGLLHEKDLMPKYELPENIFDTSDDDSNDDFDAMNDLVDGRSQLPLAEKVGKSGLMTGDKCGLVPGGLASDSEHAVLAQMFPTPPTIENQHTLSPGQAPDFTELSTADGGLTHLSTVAEPTVTISDYSFVYKPPVLATFVSSSKYCPIELPSKAGLLSTAAGPVSTTAGSESVVAGQAASSTQALSYTPSWQSFPNPMVSKVPAQPSHYSSVDPGIQSQPRSHVTSSQETSPAMASGPRSAQQLTPRTPLSLEIQSPQSNASSYMNNLKSVDNPTNSSLPEVNSVVVNIMLSDSLLNLFKDENFESCTICVCNMNIKGADVGLYLPDRTGELQYPCTCGFSAVVNRRHGRDSGLFYEDEVEITGIRDERLEARKPSLLSLLDTKESDKAKLQNEGEHVPQELLLLLQGQFTSVYPSLTVTQYCSEKSSALSTHAHPAVNVLARLDACEACYSALEMGRQAMDNVTSSKLDDHALKKTCMHHWPYLNLAKLPSNSQETLRKLRCLLPLLEDAIQKKRTTRVWESVYRITGPLSWKDFHLLAGRGSDETSEPQPIPTILAGYDKDWVTLTPQALQYWDKLMLEPYGRQRDIAYIVVCPETDYILERVKTFFRDLSQQYELCRLGRHRPIAKKIRDGILRVNKKAAANLEGEEVHNWFKLLGDHPLAANLRLYAKVCKHQLAPFLGHPGSLEKKDIFEEYNKKPASSSNTTTTSSQPASLSQPRPSPAPTQSPSPAPPPTPGEERGDGDDTKEEDGRTHPAHGAAEDADGETSEAPSVVIYLVEPFTYGQDWPELPRFAMLGLLRCYQEMLRELPENLRDHVHLQVIPLRSILQYRDTACGDALRSLALSVHTQCRRLVTHSVIGRTLTGLGPAAAASDKVLKSEPGKTSRVQLYSPPVVIAPTRAAMLSLNWRDRDNSRVLLCGYCLSEDQRWLLGVCTDNRGEMLETCTINIEIPNRNRRKSASARRIGLQKLWDFILGVMSSSIVPWRLVIGRFGRIGHGELTGWAGLLSRKNLVRASKQLRDLCHMCNFLNVEEIPCIHSACLVSMEMHPSIFVMHDTLKIEERQSSRCQLTTPRDASVTHILVMPTSATASSSQGMTTNQPIMDEPIDGNLDLDEDMDLGDMTGIGGIDDIGDITDLFTFDNMMMDPIGHHNDQDHRPHGGTTSPSHTGPGGRLSPGHPKGEPGGSVSDAQEETGHLLQQPLAIGYYVSTAKTGPLPTWFFTACPHKHDLCPNCFKAALHVNCPNVHQQDSSRSASKHQLDSNATPDVLRYVLETYNSLSWLTMDPQTNGRRSCLPVHFVVLMQLYHAMSTFV